MNSEPKKPPISTEDLVASALAETDEDLRWDTVVALQFRGTRDVLDAARRLCEGSSVEKRVLGADILGQLGVPERSFPEESVTLLLSLLSENEPPRLLNAASTALGHHTDPRKIEPLLALLDHPSSEVRFGVVHGLGECDTANVIAALITLSHDSEPDVRDWATFALGSLIDTDNVDIRQALFERLTDDDPDTRGEALVGLARRGDPRVFDLIEAELKKDKPDDFVIEAAEELADPRLQAILDQARKQWVRDLIS